MAGEGVRCPVCGSGLTYQKPYHAVRPIEYYPCPRCGEYVITIPARASLPHLLRKPGAAALISYFIRRLPRMGEEATPDDLPVIKTEFLEAVLEHGKLPEANEQVANMILWLGENTSPGMYVPLNPDLHQSVVGAAEPEGVDWVVGYLREENFAKTADVGTKDGYTQVAYALSYKGWERYREIKRGALDSRKAFMAMQYGDSELDTVFRDCFQPAVAATGFTLKLLYEDPKAGSIDDRMRAELLTSRFIIADLTHDNRGAYWEAGFAEGAGKPAIYTCKKGHIPKVHFDTNHHLIVEWDPDDLPKAATKLKNTIRATLPAEAKLDDDETDG